MTCFWVCVCISQPPHFTHNKIVKKNRDCFQKILLRKFRRNCECFNLQKIFFKFLENTGIDPMLFESGFVLAFEVLKDIVNRVVLWNVVMSISIISAFRFGKQISICFCLFSLLNVTRLIVNACRNLHLMHPFEMQIKRRIIPVVLPTFTLKYLLFPCPFAFAAFPFFKVTLVHFVEHHLIL